MVWNVLTKRLGVVACMLGTCGQPLACMAEPVQPAAAAAHVEDVVIGEAGLLVGHVSNESGQPLPSRPVEVVFAGGVVAATQTDATGNFRVSGLREGVHQIRSGATTSSHRLWPKEAAPPQVQQVAHVSCTEDCPPPKRNPNPPRRGLFAQAFATYPVGTVALIGAGIGAAIAIPIATSQKPASP